MRPTWEDYFLGLLPAIAARSTCDRGRCAAVFVRDNAILTTGYAGAPKGFPHCDDSGHIFEFVGKERYTLHTSLDKVEKHCIRGAHAEMNCIYRASEVGVSLRGSVLYCTMFPCFRCAMALVQVGCKKVVAQNEYQGSKPSREILAMGNITYKIINSALLY